MRMLVLKCRGNFNYLCKGECIMKKYLLIFSALFFLSACSNEEPSAIKNTTRSSVEISTIHNIEQEESTEESSTKNSTFEEQDKFLEETSFSGSTEVILDNKTKRIILWKNNDEVYYKTIYLKNKNKLKIIDVHGNNSEIYFGNL